MTAISSTEVQLLLTDILGENSSSTADSADLTEWGALSNLSIYNSNATLAAAISTSPEASIAQEVTRLYEGVLGRTPDAGGLQYWVSQAEKGLSVSAIQAGTISVAAATWNSIASSFITSTEFTTKYAGIGGSALVTLLYENVLGRAPDSAGLAYWTAQLGAGTAAQVVAVVQGFTNSTEFTNDVTAVNANLLTTAALADTGTGPTYATTLPYPTYNIATTATTATEGTSVTFTVTAANVPAGTTVPYTVTGINANEVTGGTSALSGLVTIGSSGTGTVIVPLVSTAGLGLTGSLTVALTVPSGATSTTASASVPLTETVAPQVFTTGPDTIRATANGLAFTGIANGTAATYQSGDSLNGAGFTGLSLVVNDAGSTGFNAAGPATPSVTGIQTVTFNSNNVTTVSTVSGFTGLTQLNVNTGAAATVTAAATTNVTLTAVDVIGSASTLTTTVNGGLANSLTVQGATGGLIIDGTTTGGAGAQTIIGTLIGNTTIAEGGGTTVNITSTGATAAGATITVGGTGISAPTGAVVISDTAAYVASGTTGAITVTGGSTVNITNNLTETAAQAALGTDTITGGAISVTGTASTTAVTVTQTAAATAAAPSPATSGVAAVSGVTAAPGITGVTAVGSTTAASAVAAAQGVVDGAVVIADANGSSATIVNTINNVTLSNYGASSSITSSALTTLSLSGKSGTLTITNNNTGAQTAHSSALALTVSSLSGTNTINDANAEIATLNVTTAGGNSTLAAFTDSSLTALTVAGSFVLTLSTIPTSLTSLSVSGGAGFNDGSTAGAATLAGLSSLSSALTITDTGTAAFTATLNDTTQAFSSSTAGVDTITINAVGGTPDATQVIKAGTATTNELDLGGTGAYTLTALTAAKVTGFQTVGVGAAVTGTIDLSVLDPTASKIHIIGSTAGGGTITFINVAQSAAIQIDNAGTTTTVQYVDAAGATDAVTVTLNKSSAYTTAALALSDANSVGIGTVSFVTKASTFNSADIITTLTDNGLATLNVSGSTGLTIATLNEASTQATAFTINDTETNAAGVTITAFTDASLGSLLFTGSNASTITTLNASSTTLGISNTGTSAATIGTITDPTLTHVTITNSGTGSISIGSLIAPLTSLTLGAGESIGAAGTIAVESTSGLQDSASTGVTIAGAADNSHVSLNLLVGAASGKTDTITLGNANNYIADASIAGTVNVNVGTGSNLLVLGQGTTNTSGTYNVALGSHSVASGIDVINIGTAGNSFASGVPNLVVTGAATGDDIVFAADPASSATLASATSLSGAGSVSAAIGILDGAALSAGFATYGVYGGNTYIAEYITAGGGKSGSTVTIVELVGSFAITASTGFITVGASAGTATLGVLPTNSFEILGSASPPTVLGAGSDLITVYGASVSGTSLITETAGSTALTINDVASATSGTYTFTMQTPVATSLTVNDISPSALTLSAFGAADTTLASVTVANNGAGVLTLSGVNNTGNSGITVTDTGSGVVTISALTAGTNTANQSISNSGAGLLTITAATMTAGAHTLSITSSGSGGITDTLDTTTATTVAFSNTGTGTITEGGMVASAATALTIGGTGAELLTITDIGAVLAVTQTGNANVTLALTSTAESGDAITFGNGTNSLTITDTTVLDTLSITVGTGTNGLTLSGAHTGVDTLTFSAGNGGSTTSLTTVTNSHTLDTYAFHTAASFTGSGSATGVTTLGAETSVAVGVAAVLAQTNINGFTTFTFSGNTYIYEYTGTTSTAELFAIVGAPVVTNTDASHIHI